MRHKHTVGDRELVTMEQAAEYLGVVPLTIRRRIAAGQLKAYRLGPRIVRVDMADVEAMLVPIKPGESVED